MVYDNGAVRRILSLSSAYIFSVALLSAHFEPLTFPGLLLSIPPPMLSLNWGHNCEVLSQRIGRLTILSGNASNLLMRKLQHPPGIDSEAPSTSRNANANNFVLIPSLLTHVTHYSHPISFERSECQSSRVNNKIRWIIAGTYRKISHVLLVDKSNENVSFFIEEEEEGIE